MNNKSKALIEPPPEEEPTFADELLPATLVVLLKAMDDCAELLVAADELIALLLDSSLGTLEILEERSIFSNIICA